MILKWGKIFLQTEKKIFPHFEFEEYGTIVLIEKMEE